VKYERRKRDKHAQQNLGSSVRVSRDLALKDCGLKKKWVPDLT